MPNAHVNKVVYGSSTLIDLTADTVTPATLMQGYTAHDASGAAIVGTASGGGSGGNVWQDAQGYVHLDDEGGGSSVDVEPLSVTQNGVYTAPSGTAYSPVTVNVSGGGGTDYKAFVERTTATPSLPSDLTTIGAYACYFWSSLALTSLPSGLTTIGMRAFDGCTDLALTSLPSGVTSIGDYAFQGCASLDLTSLPSGLRFINSGAFRNCTSLALTSLPSSVERIYANAFQGCTSLGLTSLPSHILTIETSAFSGCTQMPLAEIPDTNATIGTYAFQNCKAITSLDISNSNQISANAFNGCSNLTELVIRRTSRCTLSNVSAFASTPLGNGGSGGTVYVPSALISSYQTANNWSTLYNNGTVTFVAIEGSKYE